MVGGLGAEGSIGKVPQRFRLKTSRSIGEEKGNCYNLKGRNCLSIVANGCMKI